MTFTVMLKDLFRFKNREFFMRKSFLEIQLSTDIVNFYPNVPMEEDPELSS